jgi:hypothetical protein
MKHDSIRPDLFRPALTSTYHLVSPVATTASIIASIPRCFLSLPPPQLVPFAPIDVERTSLC